MTGSDLYQRQIAERGDTHPPAKVPAMKDPMAYDNERDQVYAMGWNDCRAEMLTTPTPATTPQPSQQWSVPEEYRQALQDALDIIKADANTEENYGSLCRIGHVLSQLTTPTPATTAGAEWLPPVDSLVEVYGGVYRSDDMQWMRSKVYAHVDGKVLARSTTHSGEFVLYPMSRVRPTPPQEQ